MTPRLEGEGVPQNHMRDAHGFSPTNKTKIQTTAGWGVKRIIFCRHRLHVAPNDKCPHINDKSEPDGHEKRRRRGLQRKWDHSRRNEGKVNLDNPPIAIGWLKGLITLLL